MGKVLSEAVGLAMAPHPTIGTDPTAEWMKIQPEKGSITGWGRKNEVVEDTIYSPNMTPEAGDVVGWKVNPSYSHKVNYEWLNLHAGPLFRCIGAHPGGKNNRRYRVSAVVDGGGSADSFTVPALGDVPVRTLIRVRGSRIAANNGTFETVAGSTDAAIKVATGTLTAEASPPSNMTIDIVGFVGAASDLEMNAAGHLISTTEDLTTRGFRVGSRIVVGTGVLGTSATSFATRKNNCLAYVKSVAAHLVELERHCFSTAETWTPTADDGDTKTIQIALGSFYRNYPITHANYSEALLSGEKSDPRAGSDGTTRHTLCRALAVGACPISAPLKNKITATPAYVGTDATKALAAADRIGGAGTLPGDSPAQAYEPLLTAFADTANDLEMVRLTKDNVTLVGAILSWTLTINNNVTPLETQGTPGATDHEWGEFSHQLQTEAIYNNSAVLDSATDNDDTQWDGYIRNHQFAFNFDMPRGKIRDDELDYQANKRVRLKFNTPGFRNEDSGICGALTLFGYVPDRS